MFFQPVSKCALSSAAWIWPILDVAVISCRVDIAMSLGLVHVYTGMGYIITKPSELVGCKRTIMQITSTDGQLSSLNTCGSMSLPPSSPVLIERYY